MGAAPQLNYLFAVAHSVHLHPKVSLHCSDWDEVIEHMRSIGRVTSSARRALQKNQRERTCEQTDESRGYPCQFLVCISTELLSEVWVHNFVWMRNPEPRIEQHASSRCSDCSLKRNSRLCTLRILCFAVVLVKIRSISGARIVFKTILPISTQLYTLPSEPDESTFIQSEVSLPKSRLFFTLRL